MRRRLLIVPAIALSLLVAGCGGDDESSDGDDTTTTAAETTTTAAGGDTGDDEVTEPSTSEPGTGTDTTEAPDTTEVPDTTQGGGDDGGDFCVAYTALEDADESEDIPDAPTTVQEYVDGFTLILPYAQDALAAAPAEIEDDLGTLVGSIEDLLGELEGIDDVAEAEARLEAVFSDEQLNDAGDRVDDYYEASCPQADDDDAQAPGVDPGTGQPPATIAPPDAED